MNKVAGFFFLFLLASVATEAKNSDYSISKINDSLKKNANAVLRNYKLSVEISTDSKTVTVKEYYVLTVLTKKGAAYGNYKEWINSFNKIKKFNGTIYDRYGNKIRKVRLPDLSRKSSMTGYGFYDDTKVVSFNTGNIEYPYTVEYEAETEQSHTFSLPVFFPNIDDEVAIEHAELIVVFPKEYKVRYKDFGYSIGMPEQLQDDNIQTYRWACDNVIAKKEESYTKEAMFRDGTVLLGPTAFSVGEYQGKMNSWKELGKFIYDLNKGLDSLPDNVRKDVSTLVSENKNKKEIVSDIYNYLQENTRYVAIEYGINGWKSLPATYTAQNKYGDCKALSVYMMALLKEAGISSNMVLVYAGRESNEYVLEDFPSTRFNHMILSVPIDGDTVWLECTSKDLPAGYLSDFTEGRKVLVLGKNGGTLTSTPAYDERHNQIFRNASAEPDIEKKKVILNIKSKYSGQPAVTLSHLLKGKKESDVKDYASRKFSLRSYDIINHEYQIDDSGDILIVNEATELKTLGLIRTTKEYYILDLDLLPLSVPQVIQIDERVNPFYIDKSISIIDTFRYKIPGNLMYNDLPEDIYVKHIFGEYSRIVEETEEGICIYRKMILRRGEYEASLFRDYEGMNDSILKDGQKMSLFTSKK